MPSARAASKRKYSAVATGAPIGAPPIAEPMQQALGDNSDVKVWTPALYLTSPKKSSLLEGVPRKFCAEVPYAVLILNQPIKDVELFVTVCRQGRPRADSSRG